MKYFLIFLLAINPVTYISEVNELQKEAKEAYANQNFYKAIRYYETLINDLQVEHEGVFFNLAHAYFKLKDDKAIHFYQKSLQGTNTNLQSKAMNQLGYLAMIDQNYLDAKTYFQDALLKNSNNANARYNLELLLKKIKNGTLKIPQQDKTSKQTQETNNSSENQNTNIESKTSPNPDEEGNQTMNAKMTSEKKDELQSKKLEEIKLNREKAEAILEALRNQEIQYIQQLPRQNSNKNTTKRQLPNW